MQNVTHNSGLPMLLFVLIMLRILDVVDSVSLSVHYSV